MSQKISSQAFLEKILKTHKIFSSVDKKVTFHKRQTYSNSDLFEWIEIKTKILEDHDLTRIRLKFQIWSQHDRQL